MMPTSYMGRYVTWDGGRGRVDLVVTRGAVPGVAEAVAADGAPVARVVVWQDTGAGWTPTQTKAAVPVAQLCPVEPFDHAAARQDAAARLVAMVATHDRLVERLALPPWARPPGVAVKTVFGRGQESWPGEHATALTAEEWALSRVEAFLAVAAGVEVPRYRRDVDQLPVNHPAWSRLAEQEGG